MFISQAQAAKVPLMQWRHPELDVENVQNQDYKALLSAETVMASTLESFKADIVNRCQQPEKTKKTDNSPMPMVFINADRDDLDIAKLIQNEFKQAKFPAAVPLLNLPTEKYRENLKDNLVECDALLHIYGQAEPTWVQGQLRHYNKIKHERDLDLRIHALCIGLPPEPPEPKPDIGLAYPELREIDCRDENWLDALRTLIKELRP